MAASAFGRRAKGSSALLLAFALTFPAISHAAPVPAGQLACGYAAGSAAGVYNEIGGTPVFLGNSGPVSAATADIALPFPFVFCQTAYTTVTLTTNGYIQFGPAAPAADNDTIPVADGAENIAAPWWDTLKVEDPAPLSSSVSYEVAGVSPLRIFTIQWKNVSRASDTAGNTNLLNFQVRLHETTHLMEFAYGGSAQIGAASALSASAGIENADGSAGLIAIAGTPNLAFQDFPAFATVITFRPVTYTLAQFASGYSPLAGGATVWDGSVAPRDEATFHHPLPFDFVYWGKTYSELTISSNGFVSFGSTSSALNNADIPSIADPNAMIAPWWDDLVIENFGGAPGTVKTLLAGSQPFRTLTIEFQNASRIGDTADNFNHVDFQIRLQESAGIIDVAYGPKSRTGSPPPFNATSGAENAGGTDGFKFLAGGPLLAFGDFPAAGTTFRLTPSAYIIDRISGGTYAGTSGTAIWDGSANVADDDEFDLAIPFEFSFFGRELNSIRVSSNGYLTFGTMGAIFINAAIPNPAAPNDFIAPWWDDLRVAAGFGANDKVEWSVAGAAPNRELIVEYESVSRIGNNPGNYHSLDFQARLKEGSNEIDLVYGPALQVGSPTSGFSATAGIENINGTSGLEAIPGSPALALANFPASGTRLRYTPRLPDLRVTGFAAETLGGTITYQVTVSNFGSAPTPGGFQGELFLRRFLPPGAGDAGDATLDFGVVAPGESRTTEYTETGVQPGPFLSWFFADGAGGNVQESDESNNASRALFFQVGPAPDLRVVSVDYTVGAGNTVDYAVTIENAGAADAVQAFDVALFYDEASAPEQNDLGDSVQSVAELDAGAETTLHFMRPATPPGSYNSFVYIDAGINRVVELSEENNVFGPFVVAIQPDLVISAFTAEIDAGNVTYRATVQNQGTSAAGAAFDVHLFFDRPGAPGEADAGDQFQAVAALDAGASTELIFVRNSPPGGIYQSWVYADGGSSAVAESNETNNAGGPVEVSLLPDIEIAEFSQTGNGAEIDYSITVRNSGGVAADGVFRVELFYDRALPPGQNEAGDDSRVIGPLGPGEEVVVEIPRTGTPDGAYASFAYADGLANNVIESDEANNIAGPLETVAGTDLVLDSFTAERSGHTVVYRARVRNRGSVGHFDKFDVALFYDRAGAPAQTDTGDEAIELLELAAGQTIDLMFIRNNTPAAVYASWCYADGQANLVPEVSEANNLAGPAAIEVPASAEDWMIYP